MLNGISVSTRCYCHSFCMLKSSSKLKDLDLELNNQFIVAPNLHSTPPITF